MTLVVDRLAEVLLIQVLRTYFKQISDQPGFFTARADFAQAPVFDQIHKSPSQLWSVVSMARETRLSRSAFSERLRKKTGMGPMRYVTLWRMRKASELLFNSDDTIEYVADAVGYDSEWAFSKAFKRAFGVSPGAAREETRANSRLPQTRISRVPAYPRN